MTYDAAGNLTTVVETGSSSTITYSALYDGDGHVVSETNSQSPGSSATLYAVRSTVLDGEVLTRIDQSGQKKVTHVPTFGLLIAKQVMHQGSQGVGISHRNPLGTTEMNQLVIDPLGNVLPFQGYGDPRPPVGTYTSASMSGLSASLANPHAYGNGCLLDGIPVNCNLAMSLLNNGSAGRCPRNDCGPQRTKSGLSPIGLIEEGWVAWIQKRKKNPPRLNRPTPAELAARKPFKREHGGNPYNVGKDEKADFNLTVIKQLVTTTLRKPECRTFFTTVLQAVSAKNNPVLENGDLEKIFEAFMKEGKFTRDPPLGLTEPAHGSVDGLIGGNKNNTPSIYLNDNTRVSDRTFQDAYITIGELFHLAGSKDNYTDKALSDAIRKTFPSYDKIINAGGNIYSDKYLNKGKESATAAYSYYFHTIQQRICQMTPMVGYGQLH
jgi:YD repeat-containing protein